MLNRLNESLQLRSLVHCGFLDSKRLAKPTIVKFSVSMWISRRSNPSACFSKSDLSTPYTSSIHAFKSVPAWFDSTNVPVPVPVRVLSHWNVVRAPLFLE